MVERTIDKRMSAQDALNHVWFKKTPLAVDSITYTTCNLDLLENYQRGNNLVAIIESYLSML